MTVVACERRHGHAEMPGRFPWINTGLHEPRCSTVAHDVRRDFAVAIIEPGKL